MRPARVSAAPAAEKYVAAVVAKDAAHRSSAAEEEIINKRQTVRNRRVVLALFCLYAVGLGLLVVLVPSQKESLLLAGRKKNGESSSSVASFWLAGTRFRAKSGEASFLTIADLDKIQVLHCCGLAAFASISLLGILGLAISADAIKRRVSTLTLPCSLLGTFCYALLITDSTPVMVGAATGQHPVYPSKLLSWVFSTTLMMYTLWSAGETPVRFLLRGLALNAVMLLSGFTASLSDGSALHLCLFVAFGCFVGMGYHQWMFFGGDVGDHPLTHRANRAILKTKFIMATAWTAFPCIYMLQFTTVVSPVQAEALMVAADVFAKALLVCATQHGIVCMASDRMNVAMQQMAIELFEDLREQEKQKDKFFATVTNEICRPLKQMVALIDSLMLTHEGGMSKKLKDAVKTVRDSGGRLQQLVGNIVLDYSAAGKECKLRLTFEPVNFSKIVGDAVLLIEPLLRSNVSLRVNVPNDLPMIEADRNRLTQVMFNLLGSAAESTQAGEISIVASVENNVVLRVEVKDSSGAAPPVIFQKLS